MHVYKVQLETSPRSDEWFNANVTGSAVEARGEYDEREAATGDIQRVRLKKGDEVIAISMLGVRVTPARAPGAARDRTGTVSERP